MGKKDFKIKLIFYRTLFSQSGASITMGSLASYLRKHGFKVDLCFLEKNDLHRFEKILIDRGKKNIIHCIETHRYKNNKVPRTKEAQILFDADKLDAIGTVGIARAFLFAGEIGAKLHDKEVKIKRAKSYNQDDTAYKARTLQRGILARCGIRF